MPVPTAYGPSVISIGMLKPRRDQVVAWRGPMLDRALVQMLSDVFWGDLDALLLDLPPGTGDVAISLGQHLPNAEVIVVTTPQEAAAEVAERAGTMASMMHQRVSASSRTCPTSPARTAPSPVAPSTASTSSGRAAAPGSPRRCPSGSATPVRVLGEVPLDPGLREGGDAGRPIVVADPDGPGGAGTRARSPPGLIGRGRNLVGMQLGLTPAGKF